MNDLISICIPTYRRPDLLTVAIGSCLGQRYRPLEIVISDDSPDDATEAAVAARSAETPVPIRYVRNRPGLGQNANVNQLFRLAQGDRLVLLHDDDYLLPDAVERLAACWNAAKRPVIAYGRQLVVGADGTPVRSDTEALNTAQFRTSAYAGRRPTLEAALLHQIPNDGYLVLTEACRRVRYPDEADNVTLGDFEFTLRLGTAYDAAGAVFVDEETAAYRNTHVSVTTDRLTRARLFPIDACRLIECIDAIPAARTYPAARDAAYRQFVSWAVKGYAIRGMRQQSLRWFFSRYYPRSKRFGPHGLYHLTLMLDARLDALRPYRYRARPQHD